MYKTPFFIALQFLTRLKLVNQTEWTVEDFGKSVIAFPYVGLIIGLIFSITLWRIISIYSYHAVDVDHRCGRVFTDRWSSCGGLMDTSDGLFSGRERERKLEIMKDSRVRFFWGCCLRILSLF